MKKLPLIIFSFLCLSAIVSSFTSYKHTERLVRDDLDHALQMTIAFKGIETMRQDSIRAYNALAQNDQEHVTITTHDNILRQNIRIRPLKDKAFLAYDISKKEGKFNVNFRSDATCSFAMIFSLSDQRLPMLFSILALFSLYFSFRTFRKEAESQLNAFGGIWFDNSRGKFMTSDKSPLHLTPMQQELMEMFFNAEDHTITKQHICERLWPKKPDASDTLYTLIRRLKPIIESNSKLKIESDRGKSYSLKANDVD